MEDKKNHDPLPSLANSAQDALAKHIDKKTLQLILRQIPIDFWARDAKNRRIVFQSDQSVAMWGNLHGVTFDETRIPPELIAKWNEEIDHALQGETIHHEGVLPDQNGRSLIFRKSFSPIRDEDGSVLGVLGIFVDITEQREKERLLTARRKLAENLNRTSDC
ncbi:MAG: PAS domain-containing protein, partial [Planctomycetia bacterium]